MLKGATSKTDVSSTESLSCNNPFGLSACVLSILCNPILGLCGHPNCRNTGRTETVCSCSLIMCFLNCSLFESFRKPEAVLFTLWLPSRVTYWIFNSCNEGNFWKKEEKPFPSKVSKVSQEMIPSNGLSIVGHLIDAGRPIVSSDDINYCKLDWQQYTRKSFCWITFSTILLGWN